MKRFIIALLAIVTIALAVPAPVVMAQSAKDSVCKGIGLTGGTGDCSEDPGQPNIQTTIERAVNVISVVVGFVAVIMIIIGGFKYVTSAGESSKVSSAKDTVLFAVIGLVIVMLAQVIVRFVIVRTAK